MKNRFSKTNHLGAYEQMSFRLINSTDLMDLNHGVREKDVCSMDAKILKLS